MQHPIILRYPSYTDVENSQGIVGIFKMKSKLNELPKQVSAVLVCDGISDPGNLGTLIRTAWGLEFDAMVTIASTDPFSPKCIRSSMGSSLLMPIIELNSWKDLENEVSRRKMQVYLSVLDEQAVPYYSVDFTQPCFIVVGSESTGISKEVLQFTQHANCEKIFIPMGNKLEMSLNAAVAGGIIMGECRRQRAGHSTE
jgi:RNA methyltransferase, TrmH family